MELAVAVAQVEDVVMVTVVMAAICIIHVHSAYLPYQTFSISSLELQGACGVDCKICHVIYIINMQCCAGGHLQLTLRLIVNVLQHNIASMHIGITFILSYFCGEGPSTSKTVEKLLNSFRC